VGSSIKVFFLLVLGYGLFSLESPFLHSLHISLYAPELALGLVLYAAFALPIHAGALFALLLGLLRDGFSGGTILGIHSEIYTVVFLGGVLLSKRLDFRQPVIFMLVTAAASLLSSSLFFVFSAVFDQDFDQYGLVMRLILPQALISAPLGPPVGLLAMLACRLGDRIVPHSGSRVLE
jgi:rod shape-determining protein MreD